jgi:CheY-like chemotaxis protein
LKRWDGVIGVESTVGKGSVFWIELTLAAEAPGGCRQPLDSCRSPRHRSLVGQPLRTAALCRGQHRQSDAGRGDRRAPPDVRLLTARDGRGGIEIACASRPDVILMDISLPDISGVEALQVLAEIRQQLTSR